MTEKGNGIGDLRKYLLGDLAETSQQRIEERLMTDSDFYGELSLLEDELVDEYVGGELTIDERREFEDCFLCTPERQHKLRFAKALKKYIDANLQQEAVAAEARPGAFWRWLRVPLAAPHPALGGAMAVAFVFVVIGAVWLIIGNWRLQKQLDDVSAQRASLLARQQALEEQLDGQQARSDGLAGDLRRERERSLSLERKLGSLRFGERSRAADAGPPSPKVASFLLSPGLLRGMGDTERVIISSDASLVQLQLDLGIDDYESYRAALYEAEGDEIWTQSKLEATNVGDKTVVLLTLPSSILSHADYHVRLSGVTATGDIELVSRYYFRVIKE